MSHSKTLPLIKDKTGQLPETFFFFLKLNKNIIYNSMYSFIYFLATYVLDTYVTNIWKHMQKCQINRAQERQ